MHISICTPLQENERTNARFGFEMLRKVLPTRDQFRIMCLVLCLQSLYLVNCKKFTIY